MGKRILIVDDDEMVRIAVNELLKQEGYDVHSASGGKEALEKLEQESYDLMMLDIIMPEMDGIELCKKIRGIERHADTPIIFLTAKSHEKDRAQGLEAGANLFLSKPLSPDKLLKTILDTLS
jgi:two-component system alkaline phosphatase synthesis response regulator PhoP